ncbi:MAG TPA: NAD(P)/FAD-dependent oxidoreductase [Acidimicrobiia bacterium]|nr:NAD(P)/FAD-dependent oxidoreductase [Acidimicrobiia bacterium]
MRILVSGGGFVGTYAALRLEQRLPAGSGHEVVLVNPENFLQYQPFLPEAASGNIEPRHVVVPLREVLRHTRLVVGEVESIDHDARRARIRTLADDGPLDLDYDALVLAPGSVSRVLPVPGLADRAIGFKTIAEAIHLRNVVLSRLEAAADTSDAAHRRALLTFVFVGGGYAGVEALAELEDLARAALRRYPELDGVPPRWVLVEAAGSILPELDAGLARYAQALLARRGIDIRLETRLESADSGVMRLSDGDAFAAETLVWTTGVRPHPVTAHAGLPVDAQGRVRTDDHLRATDADGTPIPGAWAAGDSAAVPDPATGRPCPPTAQHALRQARCLADNLVATIEGRPLRRFRYRNRGQLVSLGRYRGVAQLPGRIRIRGFWAWWLHRTYHLAMMPTVNRRVRIALAWTVTLLFPRDITALGSLQRPRDAFTRAAERVS